MTGWGKAVLKYPPTWVAAVVLGATVWLVLEVIDPPTFMVVVLGALAVMAILAWPFTMSATGTLAKLQFEVPRVEEIDPQEIATLRAELGALADTQPTEQLDALLQKRTSLINVLQRRLDAGEITYARYLATSQQVFSSALDNLHEVAVASESISTIDETYIDRRLLELADDDSDVEAAERERATLERRRDMRSSQRRRIAQLLAQNESALTALDRTTTALADVPIGRKPADADTAMAELEALADRAGNYAN
jgi:PIN domain nuclease of toxin-antitoxin system